MNNPTIMPHIICVPAPLQGHINPMFKFAKLLHSKGFYITFVHTEFNFAKLANSDSSESSGSLIPPSLDNLRFETIPYGLPQDNKRSIQDLEDLFLSMSGEAKKAFTSLLERLLASPGDVPPVTCIISDAHMNFTFEVGKQLGVRVLVFCATRPCGMLGYLFYEELVERGIVPMKDKSNLTTDFLDTPVDWIPGMIKGVKLKHLPSFVTKDAQNKTFNYNLETMKNLLTSKSIILNTFDDLEDEALQGIRTKISNLYTIGPLSLLSQQAEVEKFGTSLWKEETDCLAWLDKRSPKSVIYVNYGSLATLTQKQLEEVAWGLADSNYPFLWVIRDNLVNEESGIITKDYREEIKGRGLLSSWCPQEKVLKHPSIAVFWTHSGWNSTLESMCEGIPMICWPFFTEQPLISLYACNKWGVGVEIAENGQAEMKREKVADVIKEMMEGVKGEDTRAKAKEWKLKAENATRPGGSSHNSFEKLVKLLKETSPHSIGNNKLFSI